MTGWENDKRWSDRFLPEIKGILGLYLIGEAPTEEDQSRNTDLIVLRMEAVRIACRVRRHQYLERYGDQFTIRAGRPSGVETELTKIIRGWGNYFFYGFCNQEEERLSRWLLGDLSEFRLWFQRESCERKGRAPGERQPNGDGSSHFLAFSIGDLPPPFVVASSQNWHLETRAAVSPSPTSQQDAFEEFCS